jgi:hypothetical protein
MEEKEYEQLFPTFMPTADDKQLLLDIIANESNWIVPKTGARDPLETIAEPRKSAINL